MNETEQTGATPGLTVGDVLYIIFRHKWKIVGFTLLGIVAAFGIRARVPRMYQSDAKLYISYVLESKAPTAVGESVQSASLGDTVINTEVEILQSRDLAEQVAREIGVERILPKPAENDTNQLAAAAAVIQRGLEVQVASRANVIRLAFTHSNPALVQPILTRLISSYFTKFNEVHSPEAIGDFLSKETELLRTRLKDTEESLRTAMAKVGVVSLEDDKKRFMVEIGRIKDEILEAEADLAARQASLVVLAIAMPNGGGTPVDGNSNSKLNGSTNLAIAPPYKVREYGNLCAAIEGLRKKEQEYLPQFKEESQMVRDIRAQIETKEANKRKLEAEYPSLTRTAADISLSGPNEPPGHPRLDLFSARSAVAGLEAKIKKLTEQLDKINQQATTVTAAESSIQALQRQKDSDETYYKHFLEKLAQVQLEKKASAEKVSIRPVQLPSPPIAAPSKRMKMELGALVGGLAIGICVAFLLEMFVDQSVRRAGDIETKLQLPLFMTIPRLHINGKRKQIGGKRVRLLPGGETGQAGGAVAAVGNQPSANGELAAWDSKHLLRPYSDALRDRMITHFEIKNLTHKPKLIAVTGCGENGGVSTVAAGLAASLSETGEGNVLLVDMNVENGSATHFRRGDLACDIDDALETQKRENAQVQDNLYVVTESGQGDRLPSIMPNRFKNLVPKLKASDFDYIIFDMPPVNQISITPRLAKFMDMVLVVVDSEKTNRDSVKRAKLLLTESKASIGIVLNNVREYVPKLLRQDI